MAARNKIDIEIGAEDKASSKLRGVIATLGDVGNIVTGFKSAISMVSDMSGAVVGLVKDAAAVEGVTKAFQGLAKSSGKSATEVLKALEKGSAGMVAQTDLMKTYNLAAQLVGTTFANQLPDAMGYLQKVSAATGQDMGFMMESLTRGVGRLSPMILDNLGIQVDLTAAYETYAKSIGKTVDGLTKQEQQTALTNQVMEKLAENTANMPDVADSAAAKFAQFDAKMKNLRETIGGLLLPVATKFLDVIIGGLDLLIDKIPKVVDFFGMLGRVLAGTAGWSALFVKMRALFGDAFTDAFINLKAKVDGFIQSIADAINSFDLSGKLTTFGDNLGDEISEIFSDLGIDTTPVQRAWNTLLDDIRGIITFHIDDLGIIEKRDRFEDYVREIFDLSNYTIDTSGLSRAGDDIRAALEDAVGSVAGANVDTANIEDWANRNFDRILGVVISVAGIIFGGPIGLAIGAARLIAEAINSDFLGIGAFLDKTGIKAAIEGVFNEIKGFVEGLAQSIFGGGGPAAGPGPMVESLVGGMGGGMDLSDPLQRFANNLRKGVEIIKGILAGVGADLAKGLKDLGEGISGFISNLAGADTSGLLDLLTVVGGAIGGFLTALISVGGAAIGGVLSAVGEALPMLGTALKDFISALSALGEGDIGGALTNLGNGIGNIISAIGGFVGSIADSVISFLERLLGLDLPSVGEIGQGIADFLSGIGLNLDALLLNFQLVWEGIRGAVENAWNWLKTNVFDPIINIFTVDIPAAGTALGDNIAIVWAGIQKAITDVWNWIALNVFDPIKNWVNDFVMFIWPGLKAVVEDTWAKILKAINDVWVWLRDYVFIPIATFFVVTIPNAVNALKDAVTKAWNDMVAGVQKAWNDFKTNIIDPIVNFFTVTVPAAIQTAIDKFQEFLNMFEGPQSFIPDWAQEAMGGGAAPSGAPNLGVPGGLPLPGQQLGTSNWGGGPVTIEPRAAPEVFWPQSAGQFMPNAGGIGGLTINFNGSGGPANQTEADAMADMLLFALRERGLAVPR